jgi:hypothetical protein
MNLLCLLENIVGIDQDFADFGLKVVTDGADDQAALLVDQEGTLLLLGGGFNGFPQLQQIIEIPLQFFGVAADRGGAGDQTHSRHDL